MSERAHKPKKQHDRTDRQTFAYLLLLPTVIIITTFHVLPIFYSLGLSLFNWDLISEARFAGLRNFRLLAYDPLFWKSLWNTIYYTILSVPMTIIFSLMIAMLLNSKIKGIDAYRVIYFIPVITSINAVSIVWKLIYHPNFGLLNNILESVGIPGQRWLLDPRWAMVSIVVMSVWKHLGYNVIIFLTGLKNIPNHLYEAATVDGAGKWSQFRNITWPLLSPVTFFILVMSIIGSFQVFAQIYMMTPGGGPMNSTMTVVFYLYKVGFGDFHFGYASAVAFELFIMIFALTLVQKLVVEKRVHYQ
ncbi:sugar ABC transporter permease [bacterium]|nr:sugar ABC transporter permease [candidate division CSSED10-310 bacterium]